MIMHDMDAPRKPPGTPAVLPPQPPAERIVDSGDLLGPDNDLVIRHEGRLYRLRRTRQGKLILTA